MSQFNDEMGFGSQEPVAPELETEAVEPEEKTSLLKKEISFRRKPKQPKQPRQPKQPKAKGAGLKREISFRRKPKAEKQASKPKEKAPRRQKRKPSSPQPSPKSAPTRSTSSRWFARSPA